MVHKASTWHMPSPLPLAAFLLPNPLSMEYRSLLQAPYALHLVSIPSPFFLSRHCARNSGTVGNVRLTKTQSHPGTIRSCSLQDPVNHVTHWNGFLSGAHDFRHYSFSCLHFFDLLKLLTPSFLPPTVDYNARPDSDTSISASLAQHS